MGISCAPEIFQKQMEIILNNCPGSMNFIDDIIVYGLTKFEHDSRLKTVMQTLRNNNITLNLNKCVFGVDKIEFLGYRFSKDGIQPAESKLSAVKNFREPKSSDEVRSFLGLITYLGKFIPNLATRTDSLRQLIRIDSKFTWEKEHHEAFQYLKNCLSEKSILGYFDVADKTQLVTDASPVGLGAVLLQIGLNGPRVIAFGSKSLTETEKRYCQTEKEALAIVWAIEKFHFYVCGLKFDLITDHKPLQVIFGQRSKPSARIERWVLRLQSYQYNVVYKPGKNNIADVFSRLCQKSENEPSFDEEAEHYVCLITESARPIAVKLMTIQESSRIDDEILQVKEAVDTGVWNESVSSYKFCADEYCFSGDILLRGSRIVIPGNLRESILKLAHEGHPGITIMKRRLRSKVWWPKMDSMAENMVKVCRGCVLVSNPSIPEPLIRRKLPAEPWKELAIDLLGPLPTGHYILCTIDYFSRYKEVDIICKIDSAEIIKCLRVIFARFGIPISITLDNGSQLTSEEFRQFCNEYNIQLLYTTPYWPQMNGEVEIQNRSLLKRLRISHSLGRNWKEDLNEYLLMYRATEHSTTGKSPAELMFGRKIRDKLPQIGNPIEVISDSYEETRDLDKIRKEKGKEDADRKRRAKRNDLMVGDRVLLKNMIKKNKLSTNFGDREFEIIDRRGSEIVVCDDNGSRYRRNVAHAILAPPIVSDQSIPLTNSNVVPELEDTSNQMSHRGSSVVVAAESLSCTENVNSSGDRNFSESHEMRHQNGEGRPKRFLRRPKKYEDMVMDDTEDDI